MLTKDPNKRITISQVLQHEWILGNLKGSGIPIL
jgi:hypothetical protein